MQRCLSLSLFQVSTFKYTLPKCAKRQYKLYCTYIIVSVYMRIYIYVCVCVCHLIASGFNTKISQQILYTIRKLYIKNRPEYVHFLQLHGILLKLQVTLVVYATWCSMAYTWCSMNVHHAENATFSTGCRIAWWVYKRISADWHLSLSLSLSLTHLLFSSSFLPVFLSLLLSSSFSLT